MTKPNASLLGLYILQGYNPVRCLDLDAWVRWMAENPFRRYVRVTEIYGITVSTVFLGHSFNGLFNDDEPILFETAFLDNDVEGTPRVVDCYATWDEAVEGHKAAVKRVETDAKLAMEKLSARRS